MKTNSYMKPKKISQGDKFEIVTLSYENDKGKNY